MIEPEIFSSLGAEEQTFTAEVEEAELEAQVLLELELEGDE